MRCSGQGGRKLFLVHRTGTHFELGLELNDAFQTLEFLDLPSRKAGKAPATLGTTTELSWLTTESARSGTVWDLGTYEAVEAAIAREGAKSISAAES